MGLALRFLKIMSFLILATLENFLVQYEENMTKGFLDLGREPSQFIKKNVYFLYNTNFDNFGRAMQALRTLKQGK